MIFNYLGMCPVHPSFPSQISFFNPLSSGWAKAVFDFCLFNGPMTALWLPIQWALAPTTRLDISGSSWSPLPRPPALSTSRCFLRLLSATAPPRWLALPSHMPQALTCSDSGPSLAPPGSSMPCLTFLCPAGDPEPSCFWFSEPEVLHIWGTSKMSMSGPYFKPRESESVRMGPRHQHFSISSGLAKVENHRLILWSRYVLISDSVTYSFIQQISTEQLTWWKAPKPTQTQLSYLSPDTTGLFPDTPSQNTRLSLRQAEDVFPPHSIPELESK